MQSLRIVEADDATAVGLCRCPTFGLCVTVPTDMDAGVRRREATELLTPVEEAEVLAMFLAGEPRERNIPDECPRRAEVAAEAGLSLEGR